MRGRRRVTLPVERRADAELWLYRLLLPLGVLAWVWCDYHTTLARWWAEQREGAQFLGLVTALLLTTVALLWWRRPRPFWWLALLAFDIAAVALLFPVLVRGREIPRQSSCASNLKLIGLALTYADQDGLAVPAASEDWQATLLPWVKVNQIFHCPLDDRRPAAPSYVLNPYLRGHRLADVPPEQRCWTALAWESDDIGLAPRHHGYAHVVFADGHVKAMPPGSPDLTWDPWEVSR